MGKVLQAGIIVLLVGCGQAIRPGTGEYLGSQRVFERNYELGEKQVAFVGQPVVKVKDCTVDRYQAGYMRATEDFVIKGGLVTIAGDKDTDYEMRGQTTVDGNEFTVVFIPGRVTGTGYGLLIDESGRVYRRVLDLHYTHSGSVMMIYDFRATPSGLRFFALSKEEVNVKAGYLNYELVYNGTDGKSIRMTYREYTSEDLARPAFYQDLVYESGSKEIGFRDTKIMVYEATNEKIVYAVVSDGLTEM
ncbi:MAG: hypothetical protein JSV99_02080 [Planctomycetota bacterium]|nr:MAG: hypothetical protein JSV99_02080 [Planctomycetota bacterium]